MTLWRWGLLLILCCWLPSSSCRAEDLPANAVDPEIIAHVFSGNEELFYDISWTGGIKIGEMRLSVKGIDGSDRFSINAGITDHGLFRFFYPVNDSFKTYVDTFLKLPYRYEVLQREGRGMVTTRLTVYDQKALQVVYQRDDEEVMRFTVEGPVYNEFASFFITRTLRFEQEQQVVVPTFADKKRQEVKVLVKGREKVNSMFGPVWTYKVQPVMEFRGLYDKDGDTTIWFTDDLCRIPVQINSKILIGSLTASLVRFENPRCVSYPEPVL